MTHTDKRRRRHGFIGSDYGEEFANQVQVQLSDGDDEDTVRTVHTSPIEELKCRNFFFFFFGYDLPLSMVIENYVDMTRNKN